MEPRITSVLHLYPPQRHHLGACGDARDHPVCCEVADYCARMARGRATAVPLSGERVPVFALVPRGPERLVFDEIVAEDELFSSLHNPAVRQEVRLNGPKEALDALACEIVAGAHHGTSKVVISTGAVGSGHGQLAFGLSLGGQVPQVGLLWSILDAVGAADAETGDYPRVSCLQFDRRGVVDLLANSTQNLTSQRNARSIKNEKGGKF